MRNNNYGSWSGGAPGEGILNNPAYWGLDFDGPEPPEDEDDEEEEEDDDEQPATRPTGPECDMKETNLNVNGVTPLMHNALIAQYDAIVAAIPKWDSIVPLTSHAPDALRRAYADGWRDGWNAHRISTLNCIANHDPRKGAE